MARSTHSSPSSANKQGSVLRRLAPPLIFLAALCLMVVYFYDSNYTSLPPAAKRYDTAKANIESLRNDAKRAAQRDPWEKLAAEFRAIYESDPGWPNRPAALFRAAETLEELARRSFSAADARKAIAYYEDVAQRHADNCLADDALFRAAKLKAACLKDDKGALALLERIASQYPKGDMLEEAKTLKKNLLAPASSLTSTEAQQTAGTDSTNAVVVEELSKNLQPYEPVVNRAARMPRLLQVDLLPRYREAKERMGALRADKTRSCWRQPWEELATDFFRIYQGRKNWAIAPGALYRAASSLEALATCSQIGNDYRQARDLYLRLAQEFPKSALADDSLLRAAYIDSEQLDQTAEALKLLDTATTLYADGDMLQQIQTLQSRLRPPTNEEPAVRTRLGTSTILQTAMSQTDAPDKTKQPANTAALPPVTHNMANQLGLTVRTVFIDAGHGGQDPGTNHNDVLERIITLDVTMTLGRLLESNGVNVVYSRTKDTSFSLRERTAMANAAGTDLFVSVHVNANDDASVQGFETYYLDIASNPESARIAALENADSGHRLGDMQKMLADVMLNARIDESRRLAQDIQSMTPLRLRKKQFEVRDNGAKSAPFMVLLGAKAPAVLVEIGYCTNKNEARNLLNPKYRIALAEGVAEGILTYKNRLLKRRAVQNSLTQKNAGAM